MRQMMKNKDMRWTEIWALLPMYAPSRWKTLIKVFISKFCVFNFRNTFFTQEFNFMNFFKLQKSWKISLTKISDDKVHVFKQP